MSRRSRIEQILTWGTGDFKTDEEVTYIRCNSEEESLEVHDILDEKLSRHVYRLGLQQVLYSIAYLMNRIIRSITDV